MMEEQLLLNNFREFYQKQEVMVPEVSQREFGVGGFGKKIAKRHISFSSQQQLNSFLKEKVPLFISYSIAYYEKPASTPMNKKGFLGADIVYEFDADDLKTACKQKHDSWSCPKCSASGKGAVDNCPKCGSAVQKDEWFCPECLGETKKQVFRLLDFLQNDFGFTQGISVNFSGNAGFHIHIRSNELKHLGNEARIELLDYLTAKDFDFAKHGFGESGKMFLCPLPQESKGWGKRLLQGIINLFEEADAEKIAAFGGISYAKAKKLIENKELVLKSIKEKGILFSIPGRKNKQFWLSLLQHLLEQNSLDIDRQTSVDIRKIIRVPETLHGGTGLLAKKVEIQDLCKFRPLDDAVVFSDKSVKIFINSAPKFYLRKEWFGPFEKQEAELPLYAAIYLVGRKAAKLVG